jgi:hypothetical protein
VSDTPTTTTAGSNTPGPPCTFVPCPMDGAVRANQKGCMQASLISSHFWFCLAACNPVSLSRQRHQSPLPAARCLQTATCPFRGRLREVPVRQACESLGVVG